MDAKTELSPAEADTLPPPLVFTDAAARKVADLIRGEGNPRLMLRVFVQGGGCSGLQYGFEFDETSLFLRNRFPGFDRVDSGQRVDYGVRTGIYGDGGGSTRFLVGQSYTLQTNDNYQPGSGLNTHVSDVVGRLTITPAPLVDITYRFRLDHADLALRRQEVA